MIIISAIIYIKLSLYYMGLEKGEKKIKEQEKQSHKSMGKTGHTISNTQIVSQVQGGVQGWPLGLRVSATVRFEIQG